MISYIANQLEEPGEVIVLSAHVGVEQGLVALPATPQHIVLAAEAMGGPKRVAHLGGGVGEHLRVRIGGCASGEAWVREGVRCSPQQPYSCEFLLFLGSVDQHVEVGP
jgi:hypothetical protein